MCSVMASCGTLGDSQVVLRQSSDESTAPSDDKRGLFQRRISDISQRFKKGYSVEEHREAVEELSLGFASYDRIRSERLCFLHRFVWILLTAMALMLTWYQIQERINYYLIGPTVTDVTLTHVDMHQFPTLEVCDLYKVPYMYTFDTVLKSRVFLNSSHWKTGLISTKMYGRYWRKRESKPNCLVFNPNGDLYVTATGARSGLEMYLERQFIMRDHIAECRGDYGCNPYSNDETPEGYWRQLSRKHRSFYSSHIPGFQISIFRPGETELPTDIFVLPTGHAVDLKMERRENHLLSGKTCVPLFKKTPLKNYRLPTRQNCFKQCMLSYLLYNATIPCFDVTHHTASYLVQDVVSPVEFENSEYTCDIENFKIFKTTEFGIIPNDTTNWVSWFLNETLTKINRLKSGLFQCPYLTDLSEKNVEGVVSVNETVKTTRVYRDYLEKILELREKFSQIIGSGLTSKLNCRCEPDCDYTTFSVQERLTNELPDSETFFRIKFDTRTLVQIYFKDMLVTTHTELWAYSFVALLSDIGGSVGLILGACVFTLLEVVEVSVFRLWKRFFRNKEPANMPKIEPTTLPTT